MLRSITSDYDYIRRTSYCDPTFGLKDMQSTMRMYINMSRKGKPKVAGCGAAMSARHAFSSSKRCLNCDQPGHRKSERPHLKNESTVPAAAGRAKPNGTPSTGQLSRVMTNAVPKIGGAGSTDQQHIMVPNVRVNGTSETTRA